MFVEVFVKGLLWCFALMLAIPLAFIYFFILPVVVVEFLFYNATVYSYLVSFFFFVLLNFILLIRFQDYKDKKTAEEIAARTDKLLKEKWKKDAAAKETK